MATERFNCQLIISSFRFADSMRSFSPSHYSDLKEPAEDTASHMEEPENLSTHSDLSTTAQVLSTASTLRHRQQQAMLEAAGRRGSSSETTAADFPGAKRPASDMSEGIDEGSGE